MPAYSVIIPALNEEREIEAAVHSASLLGDREVIVVDGGSTDDTAALAAHAGARVIRSERGRGVQCNAGAAQASGRWLLFLHADSRLPADAARALERAFAGGGWIGTFRIRFEPTSFSLRLFGRLARWESRFTTFGDQCITIRRDLFDQLGGFPEWPIMEDVGLLEAARARHRIHDIPAEVASSSRRFRRRGVWREQFSNCLIMARYLSGTPVEKLRRPGGGETPGDA